MILTHFNRAIIQNPRHNNLLLKSNRYDSNVIVRIDPVAVSEERVLYIFNFFFTLFKRILLQSNLFFISFPQLKQ